MMIVIVSGIFLSISKTEWLIIVLCIVSVLCAELFNTAVEPLCNLISLKPSAAIKDIKDMSAAAVLLIASGTTICGGIIFLPKIADHLKVIIS